MVIATTQTNEASITLSKGVKRFTVTTKTAGLISRTSYEKEYLARKNYLTTIEHYIRRK